MVLRFIDPKVVQALAEAQQAYLREVVREATEQAQQQPRGTAAGAEPLLTAQQLAEKLAVPVSQVYERSRLGRIPTHRIGHYVRFRLSEVLEAEAVRQRQCPT